jgi:hypothetical protein
MSRLARQAFEHVTARRNAFVMLPFEITWRYRFDTDRSRVRYANGDDHRIRDRRIALRIQRASRQQLSMVRVEGGGQESAYASRGLPEKAQ